MSVTKIRTCASRRGAPCGALLRFGAFWRPTSPPVISNVAFSFGELFSATRISTSVPSGSRNHSPFDSKPLGGSSRSIRSFSSRSRKRGMSSSNAPNET